MLRHLLARRFLLGLRQRFGRAPSRHRPFLEPRGHRVLPALTTSFAGGLLTVTVRDREQYRLARRPGEASQAAGRLAADARRGVTALLG
jgi:hypothetical protein